MLRLNSGYVLELEVINGSNLIIPSHRIPVGLYVLVSTAYGQRKTAIKTVMTDYSVPWNESLVIQGRPLMFPHWLMPIFPSTSKTIHLDIRASFETVILGRGELVGRIETTLEELLAHGNQVKLEMPFGLDGSQHNITDSTAPRTKLCNSEKSPLSGVNTQCPSLLLRARRIKPPRLVDHTASGPIQTSEIDFMTDAAHEAYALYRKSNDRNDMNIAFERFQEVLGRCPEGHPQRAAALSNLAHVILHGFSKGMQTDIDYVISLFRSALELCPEGHPDHPLCMFNLCKALHQRHLHLQDNATLLEIVKLYLDLLPLCVDGSYLQLRIIEECNALPRNPSDESILLRRKVIDLCRPHCQYHARSLNRLAGDLYARFEESGDTDDINEAVRLSREALTECPGDGRSFFLSVLAYTLKLRFHHLHDPDDINECISLNRDALNLRPSGHPARQRSLNNLARALKARYDQYSDITDLEESSHLARDAHDLRFGNSWTSALPHEHSQEHIDLRQSQSTHPPETEEEQQRQALPESLSSDHKSRPRARNIVIFGESGSGKSSVINAIAQSRCAETSSSAAGCTFRYQKHEVEISGESFVLFDTVGLNEGTAGTVPAAEAEDNLKSLLRELMSPRSNGISLLVYCVRSVRLSRALLRNYNLFYSAVCRKKVPIVVVVTGLENQEPTMDSWWDTNGMVFNKYGMHFTDHACVTTLRNDPDIPDVFAQRMAESRETLYGLIRNNCSEWKADESWFKLSFADVRNMISDKRTSGRSLPPTVIICDPSQKEVPIAHGIFGVVETCFVRVSGVKYQIHSVPEPESPIPTSGVEPDLLIYYAHADDGSAARRKFNTFCAAYRGNMIPVVVVVQGLNNSKAAQEWVKQHLAQNGAGRLFSTFYPAGDARDLNAEQELQDLIRQSCLIRNEEKGDGIHKSIVNFLGRWL